MTNKVSSVAVLIVMWPGCGRVPASTIKVFHKTPSSLSLFGSVSFLSRTSWTEEIHASLVETDIGVGIVDVLEVILDAEIGNH
jgi:hypothetical protein